LRAAASPSVHVAKWVVLGLLLPMVACWLSGCRNWNEPVGAKSPLRPAQMSTNACALDILTVHYPQSDAEVNDQMWREIDEQHFSTDVRKRLADNGFRIGIVGSHPPMKLSELLEMKGRPLSSGTTDQLKPVDFQNESRVYTSHKQLPATGRSVVVCSPVYDEVPILLRDANGVSGQTYNQAQGVFTIQATPESDGRVRVRLTPVLQHGQPKSQPMFESGGMARIEIRQARRQFDDLSVEATLCAGEMVVIGSLPSLPGSLGQRFFARATDGNHEQKLLVIRLSQTQNESLFAPDIAPPNVEAGAEAKAGATVKPNSDATAKPNTGAAAKQSGGAAVKPNTGAAAKPSAGAADGAKAESDGKPPERQVRQVDASS
jgi:hypothetical protein